MTLARTTGPRDLHPPAAGNLRQHVIFNDSFSYLRINISNSQWVNICIVILSKGFIFFFYKFIYLFIFGCLGSSLLHAGFL